MLKLPLTQDEFELDMVDDLAKELLKKRLVPDEYHSQLYAHLLRGVGLNKTGWVRKTLDAGADVNFLYPGKETALKCAVSNGNIKLVRQLLAAGANPEIPSGKKAPLVEALEGGQPETILEILKALPVAKLQPRFLNRILHQAMEGANIDLVDWLIGHGAQVDSTGESCVFNTDKATPLMSAAFFNWFEACDLLLVAGADINRKDGKGYTALAYAKESVRLRAGTKKMVVYLEARGAVDDSLPPLKEKPDILGQLSTAAEAESFQAVLRELQQLTRKEYILLEGYEDIIPGGYGFPVSPKKAKELVSKIQDAYMQRGAFVFATEDIEDSLLCVIATGDPLIAVEAVETEGPNENVYNKDLLKWLKAVMSEEDLRITGLGLDYLEAVFRSPIGNVERLAKRVMKICPEVGDDPVSVASHLRETQKLRLWWD